MIGNINPDGKQNEVLALPARGHTVVLGTAGSGKTTMALLRAIGLSNLPNNPRVLVVTFNRALVQYMAGLGAGDLRNVTVEGFHQFARGYLNSVGKMPRRKGILDREDKEQYIEAALSRVKAENPRESTLNRPVSVFIDEITFIERFGFGSLEEYTSADRIGRASANIRRDNRKWFYKVFEIYLETRKNYGYLYDWDDLAFYVYKELLTDGRERRYDHIIVDEGQDFSPMMIRALTEAVGRNGSFTFFGDVAQQIYGTRLSWRDSGINIRENKIWKFDRNYRNPSTIIEFARDITNSKYWDRSEDMVAPTDCIAAGPKPVLIKFGSRDEELAWLVAQIRDNMAVASNVIVCRNRATIEQLNQILVRERIPTTIINKDQAGFATVKGVYLSTYHAVKGLEFENVFVPFLTEGIFPDPDVVERAVDERTAMADELKLLYVATTRSKYGLLMSYHGRLTVLFPDKSDNYDRINGEEIL